jgi:hypothetical protein
VNIGAFCHHLQGQSDCGWMQPGYIGRVPMCLELREWGGGGALFRPIRGVQQKCKKLPFDKRCVCVCVCVCVRACVYNYAFIVFEVKFVKHKNCCIYDKLCRPVAPFLYFVYLSWPLQYVHNILSIYFLFSLLSLFEKINGGLWDHFAVCVSIRCRGNLFHAGKDKISPVLN